jgi:homoaconitase/3-isopropylmalate dehydratase large subunit
MGLTIAEKIINSHCGKDQGRPDQFITAKTDVELWSDSKALSSIVQFHRSYTKRLIALIK